jgi:hypothetical protein
VDPKHDIAVLRALATQCAALAAAPVQHERRALWTQLNSPKPTRILIMAKISPWHAWAKQYFADERLDCENPSIANTNARRIMLYQQYVGDDSIAEPWYPMRAAVITAPGGLWGVAATRTYAGTPGGSYGWDPPLKPWDDMRRLTVPAHRIDETATVRRVERLRKAIGDIIELDVDRRPAYWGFEADISTRVGELRGLQQMIVDMVQAPTQLHRLPAFLRDGAMKAQAEAEAAGDFNLSCSFNQNMPYCEELVRHPSEGYRERGRRAGTRPQMGRAGERGSRPLLKRWLRAEERE